MSDMSNWSIWKKYGYFWATFVLFLGSLFGHWMFAWYAFQNEQKAHGEPLVVKEYLIEVSRDTFENWQSEFLQLMWQVAGLAFLFYVGSSQSKEGDERIEEKIDEILKAVSGDGGKRTIESLDAKYARR